MSQFDPNEWYYAQGDQQFGPVTLDDLKQRVAAGQLAPSDLVWREGLTQWQAISTMTGVFGEVAQTAAYQAAPLPYPADPSGTLNYAMPGNAYSALGPNVVYVGFWWRVLAYIIDYLVLLAPGLVLNGIVQGVAMTDPTNQTLIAGLSVASSVVQIVISWLYYALMESSAKQASLGKMACGFIVVDANGHRLSFGRATGRYFAKILSALILCIGFMMVGWTQFKQGLHDQLANTFVIKK